MPVADPWLPVLALAAIEATCPAIIQREGKDRAAEDQDGGFVVACDIDGTLLDPSWRLPRITCGHNSLGHMLRSEVDAFMAGCETDSAMDGAGELLSLCPGQRTVLITARAERWRGPTRAALRRHFGLFGDMPLVMRPDAAHSVETVIMKELWAVVLSRIRAMIWVDDDPLVLVAVGRHCEMALSPVAFRRWRGGNIRR